MDREEQKERLQEIINLANETIKSLNNKEDWLQNVFIKIDELDNTINEFGSVDEWDEQDLKDSVSKALFEHELEQLYDEAVSFKEDIDSHMYDLTEKRRESLEERYSSLDDVVNKFYQSSSQYIEVYDVIENIQEAISELKLMKK